MPPEGVRSSPSEAAAISAALPGEFAGGLLADQRGGQQRVQLEVVTDPTDRQPEAPSGGPVQHDQRLVIEDQEQPVQPVRGVAAFADRFGGGGQPRTVGQDAPNILALCQVQHWLDPCFAAEPRLNEHRSVPLGQAVLGRAAHEPVERRLDLRGVVGVWYVSDVGQAGQGLLHLTRWCLHNGLGDGWECDVESLFVPVFQRVEQFVDLPVKIRCEHDRKRSATPFDGFHRYR